MNMLFILVATCGTTGYTIFDSQYLTAFRDRSLLKQGILAGIFASFSYMPVLCTMTYVTNVSYVQIFRQLGLPIGMGLGVLVLKERCTKNKILGLILILTGLTLSVPG